MEPNVEIRRLLDVMPASGRMTVKLVSKPEQSKVIDASFPLPWNQDRPIYINFDLWRRLKQPQRDLLLLRTITWLTGVKWFKPNIYQGLVLAGILGRIRGISPTRCYRCSCRWGIKCDRLNSYLAY
jgi:hypothetical protein